MVFLNDSANQDLSIRFNDTLFYTAEFAPVVQDTIPHLAIYKNPPKKQNTEISKSYKGDPGFEALIIKTSNFDQLNKPFPYYSRTLGSIPLIRHSKAETVKRMQKN